MSHKCDGWLYSALYGPAIKTCAENDVGELWANNGEYSSQVAFCPFCGYKASKFKLPYEVIEIHTKERSTYYVMKEVESGLFAIGYSVGNHPDTGYSSVEEARLESGLDDNTQIRKLI